MQKDHINGWLYPQRIMRCAVCGETLPKQSSGGPRLISCQGCRAYLYCSFRCREAHSREGNGFSHTRRACERARQAIAAAARDQDDAVEEVDDLFHFVKNKKRDQSIEKSFLALNNENEPDLLPGFHKLNENGIENAHNNFWFILQQLRRIQQNTQRQNLKRTRGDVCGSKKLVEMKPSQETKCISDEKRWQSVPIPGQDDNNCALFQPSSFLYSCMFYRTCDAILDSKDILSGIRNATGWNDYYRVRGIECSIRIAPALLSLPMTIFYVMTKFIENRKSQQCDFKLSSLEIDVIGVDEEVEQAWVLSELSWFLNKTKDELFIVGIEIEIKIRYIGMNVKRAFNGKKIVVKERRSERLEEDCGDFSLHLSIHRGAFHEMPSRDSSCDIVLLPNAGLGLYDTWPETLAALCNRERMGNQSPSIFATDFSEEAALYAAESAYRMISKSVPSLKEEKFEVCPNPFQSRPTSCSPGTLLPSACNAWIFQIV